MESLPPEHVERIPMSRPRKDRGLAMVLEILPGLFGIFGIGWIYSENTGLGTILLIGGIFWFLIIIIAAVITATAACFCTVPLSLVGTAISSFFLYQYTKQHPEIFGP